VLAVWGGENLGLDMEQRIPNKQPCKGEKRMEEGDRDRPAIYDLLDQRSTLLWLMG
jgi:hypothetical protein